MKKIDLNKEELEILKEIKAGKTEYLAGEDRGSLESLFHLQKIFNLVEFDVQENGVNNARLTESGYYYFHPDKLEADIQEKIRKMLE